MTYSNGRYCRQTSQTQYVQPVDPILLQIARDTGETRADLRHIMNRQDGHEARITKLETRPLVTPSDVLGWVGGCLILIGVATSKLGWESLTHFVQK